MRVCLSFVGTGELKPARYTCGEQVCDSFVVQAALAEFFRPEKIILFVTEKACRENLDTVRSALHEYPCTVTVIDIPAGKTEQEIWEIFSIISHTTQPDDEILLDITHAFRFLPFLAFITALYLREISEGTLSGIVYGAYEAGEDITDETGLKRRTAPVFNLTSYITLMDWILAVRSFVTFADARGIESMIAAACTNKTTQADAIVPDQSLEDLQTLAQSLHRFTASVQLAQPADSMASARQVMRELARTRLKENAIPPPVMPVLEKIEVISPFAETGSGSCWETIQKQQALITYQVEKGLYIQAAEMAREWMVSAIICFLGLGTYLYSETVRTEAEDTLRLLNRHAHQKGNKKITSHLRRIENIAGWERLGAIWRAITITRNDLAHCGMRENHEDALNLEKRIMQIPDQLAVFWEILRSHHSQMKK